LELRRQAILPTDDPGKELSQPGQFQQIALRDTGVNGGMHLCKDPGQVLNLPGALLGRFLQPRGDRLALDALIDLSQSTVDLDEFSDLRERQPSLTQSTFDPAQIPDPILGRTVSIQLEDLALAPVIEVSGSGDRVSK
jgi:hypothetical protein